MAITPEQAKKMTAPEEQRVKTLEKEIDDTIVERMGQGRAIIVYKEEAYKNNRIYKELKERYNKAGWSYNVEYDPTGREKPFVRITPQRSAQ